MAENMVRREKRRGKEEGRLGEWAAALLVGGSVGRWQCYQR